MERQDTENVNENVEGTRENGNISRLNLPPSIRCKCTICEAEFDRPANSRREVCSFQCKAERSRRYSREYQADGRRMLAEMRRQFAGRRPTEDEIMNIISKRKRT